MNFYYPCVWIWENDWRDSYRPFLSFRVKCSHCGEVLEGTMQWSYFPRVGREWQENHVYGGHFAPWATNSLVLGSIEIVVLKFFKILTICVEIPEGEIQHNPFRIWIMVKENITTCQIWS